MLESLIIADSCLEARSAAMFVQAASKFNCSITVKMDDKLVNAKSIMGMISLGILEGQNITISADGEDEAEAIEVLTRFFK